jgi:hypothetical protein
MAETAAHLISRVLPIVPYRQWVLSLPRQVRFLLARDGDLLSQVVGMFLHKVFAWQRRRARAHGITDPRCGAVTFVQRFGSLLNLNCHAHTLLPDGVFATAPTAACDFLRCLPPLPPPWDDDVARLLAQVARAVHRLVERRRAGHGDDDPADLLATEQAEAVAGSPLHGRAPRPRSTSHRSAFLDGYSLHADRLVDENDRDSLERLCRYGSRSPVAHTRLSLDASGRVVVAFRRPLHCGRTALAYTPIDFLRRLATLIPPPRAHLTRYHGVFAPNHHFRAAVVPADATAGTDQLRPHALDSTGLHS